MIERRSTYKPKRYTKNLITNVLVKKLSTNIIYCLVIRGKFRYFLSTSSRLWFFNMFVKIYLNVVNDVEISPLKTQFSLSYVVLALHLR